MMKTNKRTKVLLLIAGALLVVGGILATAGYALGGMKSVNLTPNGLVVTRPESGNMVTINERWAKLTSVDIDTSIGDLRMEEGDSFSLRGAYNSAYVQLEVSENNGALTVRSLDKHNYFSFNLGFFAGPAHEMILTYPKGTKFKDVSVKGSLGSFKADNLTTENLNVSLDAGSFTAGRLTAETATIDMDLGNCDIDDLRVSQSAQATLHTGNFTLRNSNVTNLTAKTDLGNMSYAGVLKGKADLSLDLGSLNLNLDMAEKDLSYSLECDMGSITINGQSLGTSARVSESSSILTLAVSSSLGSVKIITTK
ncbi:MAG: DUF4097 domain-containing protein [Coriobacteriales bacterium]|jgi:hypothetical protein|nr:DUF4097 domain-containing protein [Coriobacteriales bacterium]